MKMGLDFGDMPLVQAMNEFVNTLKTPLSDSGVDGLRTLFRLNLPSMTAADEALIALASPGDSRWWTSPSDLQPVPRLRHLVASSCRFDPSFHKLKK